MNHLRLLALFSISIALSAIDGQAATLANDSPFLPCKNAGSPSVATSAAALELRGVMSGPFGYLYYVYDPVKKKGTWVGMNDTENPFAIVAGDADEGYLEIRMNDGRLLHLKLREAKTLPAEINASAPQALVANAVVGPGPTSAGLTEVQADWQQEFRRRLAENAASK
jgi:hypothetical protein